MSLCSTFPWSFFGLLRAISWLSSSDLRVLLMAVALMPVVPLGVWAGKRLHDQMDEQRLYFWCYVPVGIAGLRLFIDSAMKLIG